ncbi:SMI1/KNR4 family protein [Listeria rocourtiae]|uniref:SMI1/KNR4 family protein n=1 Tax=Listeria rocourtiae TaxID=647910 RepID=UPI003D2F9A5C
MENKIQFLSKYRKNMSIVNIANMHEDAISNEWYDILKESDRSLRIKNTIEHWNSISSKELRNTISYLTQNLVDVELINYDDTYSILYTVTVGDGEIDYFEGKMPIRSVNNTELNKFWMNTPISIKNFYEKLHNGFYYFPSRAMGLIPIENITFFGNDEWGIIEELDLPLDINLDSTFGFFSTGMGGYVALDYNNCSNDNATIWFVDDQPQYNANFWDIVDEWIVIGFE